MTNLYHRTLLSDLPVHDFINLQIEAISCLEDLNSENTNLAVRERLHLRAQLLAAVSPDAVIQKGNKYQWIVCGEVAKRLSEGHALATPVPDAYSIKLQRRLATTMPPRPVVEISFKDAMAYLNMLCLGCEGTYEVMNFNGFATMLVCLRISYHPCF